MKICHLILTHKNPRQLERLINILQHPDADFYIHIDKKTDQSPFLYLADQKNVFFVKNRTKVYWAGYGTIQATLNGFEEILPAKEYAYINVISGQDFPIKSTPEIHDFFRTHQGTEFITCESIEDEWKDAAPRVRKYHLINWQIPGKFRLEKIVNKIMPARKFPLNLPVVGRSNWFSLTPAAAKYVLDFLVQHPEYVRYFKYTWGGDEFFFATILFNSPFRERIADSLIYVDWNVPVTGHPKLLDATDFGKLLASDKLFARKFDTDKNEEIINMLEKHFALAISPSFIPNK
ncbi:beta-1,6-N-acetylglucosaminyltransferase [Terrimonas sp. NA20]|uniref:Peptide O-xylosyltransferase n=1 Tax=Terrimonas ginsenosidimutans TaxID=2908004 RepID=A0ABS9KWV6_9BACT|nr:beta-1,6-N-acetylglucosaminyltransferase [Terrimonas ginsenosidimutans]MCG2616844.1 beta-1,6-N-acetylglucosaminyltransferase [Terrimonas ginsenosidimutans]